MPTDYFNNPELIKQLITMVPDFPKPGIKFRDVMPLLADPKAFQEVTEQLAEPFMDVDKVVGLEARGFIFGAAVARVLHAGFVPFRKPGKLPGPVLSFGYNLEYGSDKLEMQSGALEEGDRVLLIDDLLATGGTASAAVQLMDTKKVQLIGCMFVIELLGLPGRKRLEDLECKVNSLYTFGEDE